MANVVLCSEFGRGAVQLSKMADYVADLRALGHRVRLITLDIAAAHANKTFSEVPIYQAPAIQKNTTMVNVINYSSVLRSCGYHDSKVLSSSLRCWLHLLATLDSDLVIADRSPTAVIAAKLLNVPRVMSGNGFNVPPLQEPMATITPWRTVSDDELYKEDQRVLQVVNQSIIELGFENIQFSSIKELLDGTDQWLMSLPEIDHFGNRGDGYIVRWSHLNASRTPHWPAGVGSKVFISMDHRSPHLTSLLAQLRDTKVRVLAIIPGINQRIIDIYEGSNILIEQDAVDIKQVVNQCKIFINNAEHNLVYELLILGVPSVMLPSNLEQTLLSYRVGVAGLGFPATPDARKVDVDTLIRAAREQDQVWHNVAELAIKYQNHNSLIRLNGLLKSKFRS